ncbi:endoribonuclease Dicer homolog 2 [Tanacetum coccineum]
MANNNGDGSSGSNSDVSIDDQHQFSNARSYQIEALDQAIKQNTIVFLETGSGKTLIAIMLLRRYAHLLKKPSPNIAVFLVPTVVLVKQQAEVARQHLDLKVVEYWGDKAVDYLSAAEWKKEKYQNQLMVMTPAILKDALKHSFLSLSTIKLLIFDECHNARGKHDYVQIMMEYHHQKRAGASQLPRILGMTASPVKAKGSSSNKEYWKQIKALESVMHSKVYTCASESVLAEYISFSTPKYRYYKDTEVPRPALEMIKRDLSMLRERHESKKSGIQLGFGLASKATEADSSEANDFFTWGKQDARGETVAREFCKDANDIFSSYIPAGWLTNHINQRSVDLGLLSAKVVCLIEALAEYRHVDDMRCIIFVERVVTAIVLKSLLCELNPKLFGWKTEYTAGNNSPVQSQSRGVQNKIVDEFREGKVNIIVATSILEEGLDVQSCNLVIRFDLSSTVCSFIQSRGRARMRNSEFLLLLRSGDVETQDKVNNYLISGQIMRDASLSHAAEPCEPPNSAIFNEPVYRVESTGASLSLSSSISMVYFYCSRLPSDGHFKPYPTFVIDKEARTCYIYFPKNCPLPSVYVECNPKMLKQLASFTACIELHKLGALTDNLVPDTVEKAGDAKEIAYDFVEEQVQYVPPELLGQCGSDSLAIFHLRTSLLTSAQITISTQFQMTLLRVLLDRNITKLFQSLGQFNVKKDLMAFDYLLLPTKGVNRTPVVIDWVSVHSVSFPFLTEERECNPTSNRHDKVHTLNGLVCSCVVENSLVYTPHNKHVYCTTKRLIGLNANSPLQIREGELTTYKKYYKERHNVDLRFEEESFFCARQLFVVRNLLQKGRYHKDKESSNAGVELPAEVCYILMSPISISTFYSYSFVPSIMHRIESYLIALNLKKMHLDCGQQKGNVPAFKVLEAITTKKCLERFHLESFETLGDSFLKYAASQQLFKSLQDQHEGILSSRREKIISNDSLCRLGCNCNLPGFIRNEPFDPKTWSVPGDRYNSLKLEEEVLSSKRKVYIGNKRTLKKKVVADVAEALIGVFLSEGGEMAALSFMSWLGIKVDFVNTSYERNFTLQPQDYLNVQHLESLLKYKFRDASLLVEALTHGSYMLPDIPKCYQRLEFLRDAVLDYLITVHMYNKYPGMSPGMLTDLRSASVNNDCYAQSAVKVELHKHILHGSQDLHRHIATAVSDFDILSSETTFGWESETTFPKVLGDVIESLAGAILIDSGYNKEQVFASIRPLLEPLVTPETLKLHPVKELHDLVQKNHYEMRKHTKRSEDGTISFTIEVEAQGRIYKETCQTQDKKMAERLASKSVLKLIKEKLPGIL